MDRAGGGVAALRAGAERPVPEGEARGPGRRGTLWDPYSTTALERDPAPFDRAFAAYRGAVPRAHFHVFLRGNHNGATWTRDLFHEFQSNT